MAATYQQMTTLSSAVTLENLPVTAVAILLQAEGKDVRYRLDNGTPTASVGNLLPAGSDILLERSDRYKFSEIKVIEAAASAKLNIHYFTPPV